jgi:hypothetical protein
LLKNPVLNLFSWTEILTALPKQGGKPAINKNEKDSKHEVK